MENMWAISSGSYSDYRVHAVCASKEDAEDIVARMNSSHGYSYDQAIVEELPVVDRTVRRIDTLELQATIHDDGTCEDHDPRYRTQWPFNILWERDDAPVSWQWVRAPMHLNKAGRLEVKGTDHERVRKVFSDRKAALRMDDALRSNVTLEG